MLLAQIWSFGVNTKCKSKIKGLNIYKEVNTNDQYTDPQ